MFDSTKIGQSYCANGEEKMPSQRGSPRRSDREPSPIDHLGKHSENEIRVVRTSSTDRIIKSAVCTAVIRRLGSSPRNYAYLQISFFDREKKNIKFTFMNGVASGRAFVELGLCQRNRGLFFESKREPFTSGTEPTTVDGFRMCWSYGRDSECCDTCWRACKRIWRIENRLRRSKTDEVTKTVMSVIQRRARTRECRI